MSVYGEHGVEAVQAAKYWARASSSSTTFTDLLTFSQMELIRGMHQGLSILHHRVQAEFLGKGNGGGKKELAKTMEKTGTLKFPQKTKPKIKTAQRKTDKMMK